MINIGDKIKIVKVKKDEAMNMWGGYDDITIFVGKEAVVTDVLDRGKVCEMYSTEFDHWGAQVTRERTGYIFNKEEIELV